MEVDFWFEPGEPETGPSYASGGEPGYPASVQINGVFPVNVEGNRFGLDLLPMIEDGFVPIPTTDKYKSMYDDLCESVLEAIETAGD